MIEVFRALPQGTLAELINDQLYMSPSPTYAHQKIVQEIFRKLCIEIVDPGIGEVIVAPFDVYLDEAHNAVQPDIIIVLNESRGILDTKGYIHGVPDILVEILSPKNKDHDQIIKRNLYERFGVKEYWIVDPENKSTSIYELKNKIFILASEDVGVIKSSLLNISLVF